MVNAESRAKKNKIALTVTLSEQNVRISQLLSC